jgi:hypothetical protein
MPSDARTGAALELIEPAINAFKQAVAAAADRADSHLAASLAGSPMSQAAAELGEFAAGRIDVTRFAALSELTERPVPDDLEVSVLRRAAEILREQADLPPSRFVVNLPPGGRLANALGIQFDELGRAFGAILVAELVRNGRYDDADHSAILHGLPRHEWHRGERAVSPPLVVTLDGADLWAGEIAQFLDGNQKIVLIVRPPAPPAALVRLITPSTLVMQTTSTEILATALRFEGTAVAALMPDGGGVAEFVHLPDPRLPVHERLQITTRPRGARKSLQSWSAWLQSQELEQLYALAAPPPVAEVGKENGAPKVDPAARLAAWLLSNVESPAAGS